MAQMGQLILTPPNVKGWDGGRSWISAGTLFYRYNLANYIVGGQPQIFEGRPNGSGGGAFSGENNRTVMNIAVPFERLVPSSIRSDPEKIYETLAFRLYNAPLSKEQRDHFIGYLEEHAKPTVEEPAIRDFVQLMMSTPEYQLT